MVYELYRDYIGVTISSTIRASGNLCGLGGPWFYDIDSSRKVQFAFFWSHCSNASWLLIQKGISQCQTLSAMGMSDGSLEFGLRV